MQEDFHYYATYCAAFISGYSHEESLDIAYSAQFVDLCSRTLLTKLKAPRLAATTQLQLELMDARTDILGLQDITRIWASFHFLPRDLYVVLPKKTRRYMSKYRLICGPNGELVEDTIELAKDRSLQAVGLSMHVLADTWAHANFAGTPSLAINNTNYEFYELFKNGDETIEKQVKFRHSTSAPDDLEKSIYTNSLYQNNENAIMNLGHGRAGHLPDYSFIRYEYMPSWNDYEMIIKDNPSDYLNAFTQMIYAMKYLQGKEYCFYRNTYDYDAIEPYRDKITGIIEKRQINACEDWKNFGEKLSGKEIEAFDLNKYQNEYMNASEEDKENTFLGKFFSAAILQKSMVTNKIFASKNFLAGYSKIVHTAK